jgi:GntR family transcriptional repressor for pyruvate dehydrogenase complex
VAQLVAKRNGAQSAGDDAFHPRRIAERVADALRRRILRGELRDGDELPRQEDLLAEFGVSKPSIRGAIGILETEGLITVRRGKIGGAIVHAPNEERAAYMLALVLEARSTNLGDIATALRHLEPACAALCALREDRHESVVPRLKAAHAKLVEAVEASNVGAISPAARCLHEEIVKCSGNQTMIVLVGALESMWWAHACSWAGRATDGGYYPSVREHYRTIFEHEEILRLIERGDGLGASNAVVRHLEKAHEYPMENNDSAHIVDAVAMRNDVFLVNIEDEFD